MLIGRPPGRLHLVPMVGRPTHPWRPRRQLAHGTGRRAPARACRIRAAGSAARAPARGGRTSPHAAARGRRCGSANPADAAPWASAAEQSSARPQCRRGPHRAGTPGGLTRPPPAPAPPKGKRCLRPGRCAPLHRRCAAM